jgi:hypothetical protein
LNPLPFFEESQQFLHLPSVHLSLQGHRKPLIQSSLHLSWIQPELEKGLNKIVIE